MEVFKIIVASILSEITFLLGFVIIYSIVKILIVIYYLLKFRVSLIWMFNGILTGSLTIILSCLVSNFILKGNNLSENSIILTAIILPIIGEISYAFGIKSIFFGRVHLATKQLIFTPELNSNINIIKAKRENLDETAEFEINQKAYNETQLLKKYLFFWNAIGYGIGIYIFHHYLY